MSSEAGFPFCDFHTAPSDGQAHLFLSTTVMFMPSLEQHHSSAGKTPPTPPPTGNPQHHGLTWKPVPGMAIVQDAKPKKIQNAAQTHGGSSGRGSSGCDCVSICECAFMCWKMRKKSGKTWNGCIWRTQPTDQSNGS